MNSEEVRLGLRVRISSSDGGTRKLNGKIGTVTQIYGDPLYRAAEVKLADGGSDLFWFYQLEEEQDQ